MHSPLRLFSFDDDNNDNDMMFSKKWWKEVGCIMVGVTPDLALLSDVPGLTTDVPPASPAFIPQPQQGFAASPPKKTKKQLLGEQKDEQNATSRAKSFVFLEVQLGLNTCEMQWRVKESCCF